VGDGVNTNEKAARILLASVRKHCLEHRFRYFLMVVKCANHQTNLSLGSAVSGRAALAAAENTIAFSGASIETRQQASRPDAPHRNSCGAIVRLFKFLMSDYYTDFYANLQDLVRKVTLVESSPLREEHRVKWLGLRHLYGDGVFPPGLLECLNGVPCEWSHCLLSGSAAAAPG
jgi:hypothetical protein